MKKIILIMSCILIITGCKQPMNMNTVVNEPNFSGIVSELFDNMVLVDVNEDEAAYKSCHSIYVQLDVQLKDSYLDIKIGDEIRVYYDGTIMESSPGQLHTVYAITLINPAK